MGLGKDQNVTIQPGSGLGTILPGQQRQLDLLYRPLPTDIEGNELLGLSGLAGEYQFTVTCTTVASHRGTGNGPWLQARRRELAERRRLKETTAEPQVTKPSEEAAEISTNTEISNSMTQIQTDTTVPQVMESSEGMAEISANTKTSGLITQRQEDTAVEPQFTKPSEEATKISANTKTSGVIKSAISSRNEMEKCSNKKKSENENEQEHKEASIFPDSGTVSNPAALEDEEEELDKQVDDRIEMNVIHCRAYVIDPLCELSCNKVIFPETPCSSYSEVTIEFLTENKSTEPDCRCGILPAVGQRERKFHAWFEFRSDNEEVRAIPWNGHVVSGQSKKIKLRFRPALPVTVVEQQARILKAERLMEEKRKTREGEELAKAMAAAMAKKKKGPAKGQEKNRIVKTEVTETVEEPVDPDTMVLQPADIYPAEKSLLETLIPYNLYTTMVCVVDTAASEDEEEPRRMEIHRMEIVCPVVKPDFLIDCNSRQFHFGPVAVGTRPSQYLRVKSIVTRDIFITLSVMNPMGPFFIPSMETKVAPEHILTLPINFEPTKESEEVREYVEVMSGSTVVCILLTGWGVTPHYSISPDFLVYRFDVKSRKGGECSVEIQNSCAAPLPFQMQQVFMKQAQERTPTPPDSPPSRRKSSEKKTKTGAKEKKGKEEKKAKKEKKAKPLKRMDTQLSPEEEISLEKDFTEGDNNLSLLFTTIGLSDTNELVVPPYEKATFKIAFTIPQSPVEVVKKSEKQDEIKSLSPKKEKAHSRDDSSSMKKRSKSESPREESAEKDEKRKHKQARSHSEPSKKGSRKGTQEFTTRYAAKYNLMLGKIIHVREYIFMAAVTGTKATKDEKKGKRKKEIK